MDSLSPDVVVASAAGDLTAMAAGQRIRPQENWIDLPGKWIAVDMVDTHLVTLTAVMAFLEEHYWSGTFPAGYPVRELVED